MDKSSRLFGTALASSGTVVIAFQEASLGIALSDTAGTTRQVRIIWAAARRRRLSLILAVFRIAFRGKLRLNGGRVNAVGMETSSDLSG